eukprot:1733528-Alexandrium_andersonii.AAC.1
MTCASWLRFVLLCCEDRPGGVSDGRIELWSRCLAEARYRTCCFDDQFVVKIVREAFLTDGLN